MKQHLFKFIQNSLQLSQIKQKSQRCESLKLIAIILK